ncbi:MAG: glutamine-hydrolyzing carbamoyl-phosphate synthase small subunit [Elusimicrobiota bacterium]
MKKGILALESGVYYTGRSFGADSESEGEIVFNTSITGYQEILTDPSYCGQIVCMTYPHIGNYGINPEDMESSKPFCRGFVVREHSKVVSNWRSKESLHEFLLVNGIVALEDVDTRALTRHIREAGAMRAVISTTEHDPKKLVEKAKNSAGLAGRDLVQEVTCAGMYKYTEDAKNEKKYTVAVIDCGCKRNILRELFIRNCKVLVFPASASAKDIISNYPNGILLSNGPGDPAAVRNVIETVRQLIIHISNVNQKLPMFGICLGHQMLGLAFGGETYKLKFGHRGANHPVKDVSSGRIYITSQNHGFCVKPESLAGKDLELTHYNLYDGTLEGLRHKMLPIFSVQYHPESGPGPNENKYLFDKFVSLMEKNK